MSVRADKSPAVPQAHTKTYALGVVLAVIFLGERPSAWNWTGIAIMIAGAYLVTIPKGSDPTWLFSGQAK